jgi:glycosyltransferase involved in cell wall biosynthesis
MKVAFVMPGVGVVGRGAEAFVVELVRALAAEHGIDPVVFCRGEAPVPHLRVRALARDGRRLLALYGASRLGKKALDTLMLDPQNVEWATAALSALPGLWRGRFDAVVMEGGIAGAWACRLLRRLRGVPFVDVAHGNDPKWEGAFARQGPDRVVAFTAAAAAMIAERAPRARIAVIPHGVDLERFRPGVEPFVPNLPRPVVMTAGAVDAHKRLDLAVEAMARLGRGTLLVLGDGPAARDLDELASRRLGPVRYLRTAGPRDDMPAWYAAADCFTLPSKSESFGLAYLEAMACGLPCVAPGDAVRREVIGEGGLYCDVEDGEAYAAALREALGRKWKGRPRRRAERFPFAATARAWAALLEEVAGRRVGGPAPKPGR